MSIGKGLGAGFAPLGVSLCRRHVYDALDHGSREFDLGHTWDGAPLPTAVGLAVLDVLEERDLVARVRERGPGLRDELTSALKGLDVVCEVVGATCSGWNWSTPATVSRSPGRSRRDLTRGRPRVRSGRAGDLGASPGRRACRRSDPARACLREHRRRAGPDDRAGARHVDGVERNVRASLSETP